MASSDPLDLTLRLSISPSYQANEFEPAPSTGLSGYAGQQARQYTFGTPGLKRFNLNLEQVPPSLMPPPKEPPLLLPATKVAAASFEQLSKKRRRASKVESSGGSGTGSSSSPPEKKKNKTPTIPPPYPWSTDQRCKVYSSQDLIARGHLSISGRVKCRKCEQAYEMSFDLREKFMDVGEYILSHGDELCHRAPAMWMNPVLPRCRCCGQENSVKPEMEGKKKNINWLFLFLGEMLGCCTGEQLKYFCKYNGQHRTAAKDRLLFLAYFIMCTQLHPGGPFKLQGR